MQRAEWVMAWLFALFMLAGSAAPKLIGAAVAADTMAQIGWSTDYLLLIGFIEVAGTLLFLYPRTAFFGAVLLTALFGGAIGSHLRVGNPLFSHTLFGVYLGVTMWLSLWLRDGRVRKIIPFADISNPWD